MALARVQATGKVFNSSVAFSLAVPLATPPTVGNAIVVPLSLYTSISTSYPPTCKDNYGNAYELVVYKIASTASYAAVFVCYKVVATGASFTITLGGTGITSYFVASAIEVSGGGVGGLVVDRAVINSGSSAAPTTGVTAALRTTSGEVFAVAVQTNNLTQASIIVESVSPTWTQEYEHLTFAQIVGEADTRILTGVTGTTQSCTWANASSTSWAAALVLLASASALPVIEARETQAIVETLTHPTPDARVTQAIIETLQHPTTLSARVTQFVIETLTWSTVLVGGNLVGQTVASTAAVFAPALVARDQAVIGTTRASAAALFTPTVAAAAAKTVFGVSQPSTARLFAPQVRADLTVTTATRASTAVLFAPQLGFSAQSVTGATLTSTAALFAPSVVAEVVEVDHGPTACATGDGLTEIIPPPSGGDGIPAGTIMIGGWGNTPPYRFLSPDGSTSYPPPPSLPGASCAAFGRLPNGDIAVGGGGDATFPSGGGVYKASDLTVRSAYVGDGDGGRCVAVDALGFYYLHTYVYLTNQVQITRLNGATSEVVQVWLSDPFGDFTSEDGATTTWGLHSSSLAISPDGRTAYCDLLGPVRHPTQHHHRIHVFDLSGSTAVWLGLLNADDYCYYGFGDGFMACLDNGDLLVAYGDYEQGSTIFNKGTVVRYTPAGAIVWVAGDPAGTAGVDDLEWDGLALGVPGDTHFLAYMWEFEAARPTQQMRYCWFSYATGAPDNTRNFTLPFDQDEPSGFEYNSQFVILAHAIGGDGGSGGGTPILVCADGGFPIDDEGPPAPIVTPPTVIPAGTIMVFGYGDADLLRYLSPDGSISYDQPASTPTPGAGLSACCRLSTGDVAVVGGGGTGTSGVDFPTSGAGVYQASDLSKRSEVADVHIQDGDSITSDALGYWYLIHSTVAPDPGTATHILISRLNATSQVVATWDIPLPSPYNGYVDFPGAQHIAVSEDGQTFYAMLHKLVPMSGFTLNQFIVHKFSLAGAGACLGPLMGDWDGHPSYQPMFIVPDGSGDLIVSFNRLNSTITGGETGALRRYTSSGALVWTAATPAGPGPFYWEAIALGVPGDPHFLAYAYSDDTNSSSCRYVWFDYATGTPDNARSFAPDDGAGFEFDSQFVILAHAVPL